MEIEHFTTYDGTRLAYRLRGEGPLLVCVPGGPGRAAEYLEDLGGLARTRTLVLLDARGTGASDLPSDDRSYGAESLARDVDALREHLSLERADVLGHSAGGKVAQVWAAEHADRVGRLVLVTTYLRHDQPGLEEDRQRVLTSRAGEPWYARAREAMDAMAYAPVAERAALERELRPFWYGRWTQRDQEHAASADHQMAARAASRFGTSTPPDELAARLATMTAPVLVVAGALDGLIPPAAGSGVADAFPRARLVVLPEAGHFPWVDAPEPFRAAVATFLGE